MAKTVKVKMRQSVRLGSERKRLEHRREYDVTLEESKLLVPRYASYVGEPPAGPVDDSDLSKLTVPDLRKLAKERGIELAATRKDDIIAEIEATGSDGADVDVTEDDADNDANGDADGNDGDDADGDGNDSDDDGE